MVHMAVTPSHVRGLGGSASSDTTVVLFADEKVSQLPEELPQEWEVVNDSFARVSGKYPAEETRWERMVRRALRRSFKRLEWTNLGLLLKLIKQSSQYEGGSRRRTVPRGGRKGSRGGQGSGRLPAGQ